MVAGLANDIEYVKNIHSRKNSRTASIANVSNVINFMHIQESPEL